MQGFVHPVVFGNEIGRFSIDLIERYAKAWDSTKSPSILKASSNLIFIFFGIFFFILLSKILFFLPPPQTIIFCISFSKLDNDKINASLIILAVNYVNVATPSSSDKPLAKETSKSFTSSDNCSLLVLLE